MGFLRKSVVAAVLLCIAAVLYQVATEPDLSQLKGKRVLICGASTGIGKEMALHYARHGAQVAVVARSIDKLTKVVEECLSKGAAKAVAIPGDLSSDEKSKAVIDAALKELGGLDILVLNHLRPYFEAVAETRNTALVEEVLRVNLHSYLYLAIHALPAILESKGKIMVVSSAAGMLGIPFAATYSATKHALHGFFESFRLELDLVKPNHGVSITMCILGNIDTESAKEVTEGYLKWLHRAPADDTALAMIKGTERRVHEVYYPWMETYLSATLYPFVPSLIGEFVKLTLVM